MTADVRFNEAAALHRGKRAALFQSVAPITASMRPRHYTAENVADRRKMLPYLFRASMRPRHYTAENFDFGRRFDGPFAGFNEAAALHRGKLAEIMGPEIVPMALQ